MAETALKPTMVNYFYGRIPRVKAEQILSDNGRKDGLYLLRERVEFGDYVLSGCYPQRFFHFDIKQQSDGKVKIEGGHSFLGPVELVNHHKMLQDGFPTLLEIPCARPKGYPIVWPGVTYANLETALFELAGSQKLKGKKLQNAFGSRRRHNIHKISKTYHEKQSWFHGDIERHESECIITKDGKQKGSFLMRRKEKTIFVLSVTDGSIFVHYKINTTKDSQFAIDDGPKFNSIMDLVSHYHYSQDGLCSLLLHPVNKLHSQNPQVFCLDNTDVNSEAHPSNEYVLPVPAKTCQQAPTPPPPLLDVLNIGESLDSAPTPGTRYSRNHSYTLQQDYEMLARDPFVVINRKDLVLEEKALGKGNFGDVVKGCYKSRQKDIPVAVKTLHDKDKEISSSKDEIFNEAKLMSGLAHKHIVRLIGVCKSETVPMLVLELAELGPLNKYLRSHSNFSMDSIILLMRQVAQGMAYLESKNFVHRDLAARNILLVTDCYAKISDFGMSKALGLDSEYYQSQGKGKIPMKWYAPECMNYHKFDSKSDVWSFGVTLWEACSYGRKPNLIESEDLEEGKRLEKPQACPHQIYTLMKMCWLFEKDDRPSFANIVAEMTQYNKDYCN